MHDGDIQKKYDERQVYFKDLGQELKKMRLSFEKVYESDDYMRSLESCLQNIYIIKEDLLRFSDSVRKDISYLKKIE